MREEKSKQTEGKKTTLNNIIINMRYVKRIRTRLCISQMYDYMFNEEEKKRKRR